MRWADERYVRVYTRDTGDWLALGWQAQAMFLLLLRKADRAGILATGRGGIRGLAALAGMPVEVAQEAAALLLEDGCLRQCEGGGYLIPNFIAAQEARASDKARQQKLRETARDVAASHAVTIRDRPSQDVTESHTPSHAVTAGHDASHDVTPSLAVLSRAVPTTASQGAADAGRQLEGQGALFDQPKPEKPPKAPRRLSNAEDLYRQVQKAREQQCQAAGVPFTPDRWPEVQQNKLLGPVAKVPPGAVVDEEGRPVEFRRFSAAFTEYLSDTKFAEKGWPLSLFMSSGVRSRYEQQAAMAEVGT